MALRWATARRPRHGRGRRSERSARFLFRLDARRRVEDLDAGTYWRNVSDGFFKTPPVGAIDVSLSNPAIDLRRHGRSRVRGRTSRLATACTSPPTAARRGRTSGSTRTRHIAKIRIHPTNPDIVYVAAARRSSSAPIRSAACSARRMAARPGSRCSSRATTAGAFDLAMDPTNPNVLYASLESVQRLPWDQTSGGPDSGLYKTTDGGDTWTEITRNPGCPRASSEDRRRRVSRAAQPRVGAGRGGRRRRCTDRTIAAGAGSVNAATACLARRLHRTCTSSPTPGCRHGLRPVVQFLKSTDGGETFDSLPMPHGDQHALWIDPKNSKRMIEGNDGGATVSLNGGATGRRCTISRLRSCSASPSTTRCPYRLYARAERQHSRHRRPSRTDDGCHRVDGQRGASRQARGARRRSSRTAASSMRRSHRPSIATTGERGQSPTISVWPDEQFTRRAEGREIPLLLHVPARCCRRTIPKVLYTAGNSVYPDHRRGNSLGGHQPAT